MRHSILHATSLAALLVTGLVSVSSAQDRAKCSDDANFAFLGKTAQEAADGSLIPIASYWLSTATQSPENRLFRVEPTTATIDWRDDFRFGGSGLHVSVSPLVALFDNGKTHKLSVLEDGTFCLVDSQNQVGNLIVISPDGGGGDGAGGSGGGTDGSGGSGSGGGTDGSGGSGSGGGTDGSGGSGSGGGTDGGGGSGSGGGTDTVGPTDPDPIPRPDPDEIINGILNSSYSAFARGWIARTQSISDRIVDGFAHRSGLMRGAPSVRPQVTGGVAPAYVTAEPILPVVNVWAFGSGIRVEDNQYGIDVGGQLRSLTFGADYLLREDLALGFAFSWENNEVDSYHGSVRTTLESWSGGPYFGWQVNDTWILDGWLAWGRGDGTNRIDILDGNFDERRTFGSLNLTGAFEQGGWNYLPKASLFYGHYEIDEMNYKIETPLFTGTIPRPDREFDYGAFDLTLEVNKPIELDNSAFVPFTKIGLHHEFQQINDGKVLSSELELKELQDTWGTAEIGFRQYLSNNSFIGATVSYGGIGIEDADYTRAEINASIFF